MAIVDAPQLNASPGFYRLANRVRSTLNERRIRVPIQQVFNLSPEANSYAGSTGITLRSATTADRDFLFVVYASSREDDKTHNGREADHRLAELEKQFAMQLTDLATQYPDSQPKLVLVDGVNVGSLWVTTCDDEVRLLDIGLLTEHRNQGIGTFLLRRLQEEAAESNKPLRYSVRKINEGASRFYTRLGFRIVKDSDTRVELEWTPA